MSAQYVQSIMKAFFWVKITGLVSWLEHICSWSWRLILFTWRWVFLEVIWHQEKQWPSFFPFFLHSAWTHDPETKTWAEVTNPKFSRLSHPGALDNGFLNQTKTKFFFSFLLPSFYFLFYFLSQVSGTHRFVYSLYSTFLVCL